MAHQKRTFTKILLDTLRKYFISGALIVAPLIITYLALKFLFEAIDGILSPYLHDLLGYDIPGLGLVTTVLLILLVGVLTRNYFGSRVVRIGERLISAFPVVRPVYLAAKQLVEGVSLPSKRAFKEVALVEYPRRGAWALSFVVGRPLRRIDGVDSPGVCLFVPSTPTPISGMVIVVAPEEVILLDMTVEEGIKFLVSGGIASPEMLSGRFLDAESGADGASSDIEEEGGI
ncbi:MAG TPA: DUF502 domain-containing protein [candidate division Zixibacteria bacterium]|nr:DUF502 domain-containing protein [candidate division Zixibacteria bacterium]